MIIVKAILEIDETKIKVVDILINLSEEDIDEALKDDELALADLISDATGYCVEGIIEYKKPDFFIKSGVVNVIQE